MPTTPKRIIFLTGSLLVEAGDLLWNNARRLLGLRPHGSCVVLTYHSVTSEERPLFARQMDTLLRYAKPVRADIEALPPKGGRYAAVTFDDGMQNIVDNALPELEKRSIPTTLFIITDVLGKLPDWEYFGPKDTGQERVMSEEQLRKLPSAIVEIASHTMTHPVLPQIDREKLAQEVEGSRAKLAKMLGREIKLLSFPYGAFNDDVARRMPKGRLRARLLGVALFRVLRAPGVPDRAHGGLPYRLAHRVSSQSAGSVPLAPIHVRSKTQGAVSIAGTVSQRAWTKTWREDCMTATENQVAEVLLEIFATKGLAQPRLLADTALDQLGLESLDFAQAVIRLEELTGKDPFATGDDYQIKTLSDLAVLYA